MCVCDKCNISVICGSFLKLSIHLILQLTMALHWSTIVFISYLSSTILLVIFLSILSYIKSEWKGKKAFFKAVWSLKSVWIGYCTSV